MSKYKVKASPRKEVMTAKDAEDEKKFFKVAVIVTVVVIALIYIVFNYM